MHFLESISSAELRARIAELVGRKPDIEALSYILGPVKMLEWAHTVGVVQDEDIRAELLPLPPKSLRSITAASSEAVFLWSGLADATNFADLALRHVERGAEPVKVLDFGCGCGRMTRFFGASPDFEVSGSDINTDHIDWCGKHLGGTYRSNKAKPPLDFEADSFDVVYSLSIFSHLRESNALDWLAEIRRVLRPGGIAILTTHGDPAMRILCGSEVHQGMFKVTADEARDLATRFPDEGFLYAGYEADLVGNPVEDADYGNSFVHETYIRERWSNVMDVVAFHPGGVRGWQDVTVLRKA